MIVAGALAGPLEDAHREIEPLRALRLARAPAPSLETWTRAAAGEVVTGQEPAPEPGGLRAAWGVAVVVVPIDPLWRAINDDRSKADYTDLAHVELLAGEPCSADRRTFQYLDVSVLADRWWVVDQRANTVLAERSSGHVREMTWRSVSDATAALTPSAREWADRGVQVERTEGAWLLVDLGDGRTLVEYVAASDPGGAVPAGVAARFAASGVSGTIDAMRRLALAGPLCK